MCIIATVLPDTTSPKNWVFQEYFGSQFKIGNSPYKPSLRDAIEQELQQVALSWLKFPLSSKKKIKFYFLLQNTH